MTGAPQDQDEQEAEQDNPTEMLYTLEDSPPWLVTILMGLQHCITMICGTVPIPFMVSSLLCFGPSHPMRGYLVSTIIFVSGVNTLLQSTLGVRLPIIQGGNFAFLLPSIAFLSTNYMSCEAQQSANLTVEDQEELWRDKIRLIQGSIAVSSVFQIFLGFTGLIGVLLRWITPLTILPTIMLVGLSMFDIAAMQAAHHWGISLISTAILILYSQYLTEVSVPFPMLRKGCSFMLSWIKIFKLFAVLLALLTSWLLCWLLTHFEVLQKGSPARTDYGVQLIFKSPWFYVPYPGQWGVPRVVLSAVVGCMAAGFASTVESIGDYFICARISGGSPPPMHALNRGVMIEGVGVALAGLFGTGSGINSYSENIATLVITRVGSRRVIQVSAVLMMALGLFSKFGALCGSLPTPIVASLYFVLFSYIVSASLPMLHMIKLHSPRNLFILGFSVFFSLSISKFVKTHPEVINTGLPFLDQTIVTLLQTTMFLGSIISCFLDNTIPGSAAERGVTKWQERFSNTHISAEYNVPGMLTCSRKMRWLSYLPVWPKFKKEEYFVNNPVDVEHNQKSTVDDENKSQDACRFVEEQHHGK
ncbi:solute carrier family 23 member 2-like isoform X2 [Portunus trituberculatus]|nr:solute carrier family 23 member 2-like isoform X2 [Portunus trituberculatus]XP_045105223.1 solute carrier family 23 member 2-like isoform X2 [Portunus trituberculatus]XP_045105224.1 solute carrier family 23 member 2-like isoform X2 [Portunus trituberculatus]